MVHTEIKQRRLSPSFEKSLNPVEQQIKQTVYRFLNPRQYHVFLFGSRVTGDTHRYSDYDVGIRGPGPLPLSLKAAIDEAFEESDLPYTVDVVDFRRVSNKFRQIATKKVKAL
jgi:predicted nucleotidyltransferase